MMPSTQESFCLPIAEALACGVPVVARDLPALRETADGGAEYRSSHHATEWTAVLNALVTDDSRHSALREAGMRHAARYSWAAVAAAVIDELEAR